MRILQLAPPWVSVPPTNYGGIEWVVSGLADGLVDAGHDVTLVASGGSHSRARLVSVFDEPPFEQLGDARIEAIHALWAYRRRTEFDLIHDHTSAVGPALASVADGPPVVHTLHLPWSSAQNRWVRLVAPPVRLVAISHAQARLAPADIPLSAVVYNGIPIERYPFQAVKEGYLLFVGRASTDKGPETAIRVARRLQRPLTLAIKVNEKSEREYWEDTLAPLIEQMPGIEVVPNPDHGRKTELMKRASAVLAPIQWDEPFGLVMAEANACGTPVVAFARGAAPEVVADGVSGFVVAPGDLDAFCSAVREVGALRSLDCRYWAAERFGAGRMVTAYERVYEEALMTSIDLRTSGARSS